MRQSPAATVSLLAYKPTAGIRRVHRAYIGAVEDGQQPQGGILLRPRDWQFSLRSGAPNEAAPSAHEPHAHCPLRAVEAPGGKHHLTGPKITRGGEMQAAAVLCSCWTARFTRRRWPRRSSWQPSTRASTLPFSRPSTRTTGCARMCVAARCCLTLPGPVFLHCSIRGAQGRRREAPDHQRSQSSSLRARALPARRTSSMTRSNATQWRLIALCLTTCLSTVRCGAASHACSAAATHACACCNPLLVEGM